MEQKPPARRRPRRADAPRKERLNVRFNELEYAMLLTAATAAGQSVAAYIATVSVAVAKDELSPAPVDLKDKLRALGDARVAVDRIGNNANQIAHVLNSQGEETPERLAAVLDRVARALETLDAATLAVMEGRV
ncbi:MobC family plasmid mobilization relaxosome protein [Streptomyces sp. NBC_00249]|uniref:plasmid mobilization protein n=1 Tax=Streptomyces sp. NBC_00249 TaxID=2975690 RepID=UPI00224D9EA3|nr:plasmid mobilization relaxosome protein MobC [Streptomyces sp. NBC_00249]MCX5199695.1 MobC family plasmid mobilization relaxosome protein [Streptomyces sp. NBC_00249]